MPALSSHAYQPALPAFCNLAEAVERMASSGIAGRGAIFTRPEVVEFILDLVGYTTDKPLHRERLLEPSFGGGDFLLAAVRRLIGSYEASKQSDPVQDLADAIRAVELHKATFSETFWRLNDLLVQLGLSKDQAGALCQTWLIRDDFLLTDIDQGFTCFVGNPPYVRQELIPQRTSID